MNEKAYIDILTEELIPAMGCTEPIALAYAAAKAREVLGELLTKLSAYCGAVSAGAAAGAGIAYLNGGGYKEVIHTVVNALAIVSGMVCDGAKASCAAKIALAVDAGILGYEMYKCGQQFYSGDGIVAKGPDATIKNVGLLGKDGMKETNQTIINMMTGITEK